MGNTATDDDHTTGGPASVLPVPRGVVGLGGEGMIEYHIFTATLRGGDLATFLISDDALADGDPEVFLPIGVREISDHGTVEISGPEEHMLTEYFSDKS